MTARKTKSLNIHNQIYSLQSRFHFSFSNSIRHTGNHRFINSVDFFDPFITNRESETGLGLAIVNKIIENHDGEIQIKSPAPDRKSGCKVSMKMPIDKENIQIIE
jgi:nitrogen-specific signal transduction histidine kinase